MLSQRQKNMHAGKQSLRLLSRAAVDAAREAFFKKLQGDDPDHDDHFRKQLEAAESFISRASGVLHALARK